MRALWLVYAALAALWWWTAPLARQLLTDRTVRFIDTFTNITVLYLVMLFASGYLGFRWAEILAGRFHRRRPRG